MDDGPDEDVADGKELTPEEGGVFDVSGTEDLGGIALLVLMWIGCFALYPSLNLIGPVETGCSKFVWSGSEACCCTVSIDNRSGCEWPWCDR